MNERQVSRGRLAALNGRDWVGMAVGLASCHAQPPSHWRPSVSLILGNGNAARNSYDVARHVTTF